MRFFSTAGRVRCFFFRWPEQCGAFVDSWNSSRVRRNSTQLNGRGLFCHQRRSSGSSSVAQFIATPWTRFAFYHP